MSQPSGEQKKARGPYVKTNFGYADKGPKDLKERLQTVLTSGFASNPAKSINTHSRVSFACVQVHNIIKPDLAAIVQIITEFSESYSDLIYIETESLTQRKVYLIVCMRQFRTIPASNEVAHAALQYAFYKNRELFKKDFSKQIGSTLIDYSTCNQVENDDFLSLMSQKFTGHCRNFDDAWRDISKSPVFHALSGLNFFKLSAEDFSNIVAVSKASETDVDTFWCTIPAVTQLLITTLTESLVSKMQRMLHSAVVQNFNVGFLTSHPELRNAQGQFEIDRFTNFVRGFNSDIVSAQFFDAFVSLDKKNVLKNFSAPAIQFIEKHKVYELVTGNLRWGTREELSNKFKETFQQAMQQLRTEYELTGSAETDQAGSLTYSTMQSWAQINSAQFLPISVYTIDQWVNFLRISIVIYKWMAKTGLVSDADSKENLFLYGAPGSGKSSAPVTFAMFFRFMQMNIHEHFQPETMLTSNGFFNDEYSVVKMDEQRMGQLKTLTDPNAILRFEIKNKPSQVRYGSAPLILTSNQDPREPPGISRKGLPAYQKMIEPLQRRFKCLYHFDTFTGKPLPLRTSLNQLHASFAKTYLAVGLIICQNLVFSDMMPVSYVSYKGVKFDSPTDSIRRAIQSSINESDEPILYVLNGNPTLCDALFKLIDQFEEDPSVQITSTVFKAREATDQLKTKIVALFDNAWNNKVPKLSIKYVDFTMNQQMHNPGIQVAQQVGKGPIAQFLRALPTHFKFEYRPQLVKMLESSPMDEKLKVDWVRHAQSWYSLRVYIKESQKTNEAAAIKRKLLQELEAIDQQQRQQVDDFFTEENGPKEQHHQEMIEAVVDTVIDSSQHQQQQQEQQAPENSFYQCLQVQINTSSDVQPQRISLLSPTGIGALLAAPVRQITSSAPQLQHQPDYEDQDYVNNSLVNEVPDASLNSVQQQFLRRRQRKEEEKKNQH